MKITEVQIDNFGKLRNEKFTFSDGITVIYGRNEAGKSTLHTFLLAMLFGLEIPRGRNKAASDYGIYEPWDTASFYCGSMRFLSGNKPFFLRRNFYHKDKSSELRNELDQEELSVEYGDLSMLLGGIGKNTFENTWCIRQTKAQTQKELGMLLYDYLANLMESGNATVRIPDALLELNKKKKNLTKQQKEYETRRLNEKNVLLVRERILSEEIKKACQKKESLLSLEKELQQENERIQVQLEELKKEQTKELQKEQQKEQTKEQIEVQIKESEVLQTKKENTTTPVFTIVLFLAAIIFGVCRIFLAIPVSSTEFVLIEAVLLILAGFTLSYTLVQRKKIKEIRDSKERIQQEALIKQQQMKSCDSIPKQSDAIAQMEDNRMHWNEKKAGNRALQNENEQVLEEMQISYLNIKEELKDFEATTKEQLMYEQKLKALDFAGEMILKLTQGLSVDKKEQIYENTVSILSSITGQKYDKISFDEKMDISLIKDAHLIPLNQLSQGTLEQVYFAIRMAVGKVMMMEEEMFFSFDDAFVMYDDERLKHVLRYLSGQTHQSLIFTCSKREMELLDRENIPYHKIVLVNE